jgi:hypothetical protein
LTADEATQIVKGRLWPLLCKERDRVARIDRWMRWDHDDPHRPRYSTREYRDLSDRSQAPWGYRVVTAATDQLIVDGYRPRRAEENTTGWRWWLENGMNARQGALHESIVGYGLAYVVVLPGKSWMGDPLPVMRGLDPSQMVTVYDDPAWDDWPRYALRAEPQMVGDRQGWRLRLYDATDVHHLVVSSSGDAFGYVKRETHGQGVCPVVRYTSHLDLRGRAAGDVEPIIPVLGRIDQTTFDRLVVQRFASWKVRTIAGMSMSETVARSLDENATDAERAAAAQQARLRLKVEDLLIAEDPDTKFGTLDETPLSGFIEAHDADVRALAALSQSPAHELVGQMANLSAEALAAAEASLTRRVKRLQRSIGEGHNRTFMLAGRVMGDDQAARDVEATVQWADLESRSLAQEADALGKLATMLQLPVELLWDKVSILTQTDVEEAKRLVQQGGGLDALLRELAAGQASPQPVG